MKKKLFLLPLFSLLITGCSFEELFKKDGNPSQNEQNEQITPEESEKEPEESKEDDEESIIHVTGISISKKTLSLYEGTSEQLTYVISPNNATNKNVKWSTSNSNIASVEDGLVKGWNEGTATISVKSIDQSKVASCTVTVLKIPAPEAPTITSTLVFNDLGYTTDNKNYTDTISIDENVTVTFAQGDGDYAPACYKGSNTKKYEARAYAGNYFTICSDEGNIKEIVFTFSTDKPGTNEISSNVGSFTIDTWQGDSGSIVFTIGGSSGHRRFSSISVTYEGETPEPESVINLGNKSIAQVKNYIGEHPFKTNSFGNGVNENRYVTIKGFALAKIDLVKSKKEYGLDVSKPGKIIMADETGYIAVATNTDKENCLWGKIGDHICEETSKYVVTGYISMYLGHPELLVTAYEWNKDLDITYDVKTISEATTNLDGFYDKAINVNYNCAGHGYGEVITINNLKCYFIESDRQGKRYYNFTDGQRNIRVNAYNLGSVSEGHYYDVTGIISLKNLSPIIIAFKIEQTYSPIEFSFEYSLIANEITITDLKKIKGSQEDTSNKYPDVINAFGSIFKTEGYLTLVVENGKYYVGISDSYINRDNIIDGKDKAMANYGISLIKNDNFWNTTETELYNYNPLFDEYIFENKPISVYYVVRQLRYQENKALWEILLIPDFLDSLSE